MFPQIMPTGEVFNAHPGLAHSTEGVLWGYGRIRSVVVPDPIPNQPAKAAPVLVCDATGR
jgi:hypothetical protein